LASTGAVTANGTGIFNISGITSSSTTIGALNGNGAVTLGTKNLTFGNSIFATFSGIIGGSGGSITKQGTNTQTLSGTNTYRGGTIVKAGTLAISNDGNLGSGGSLTLGDSVGNTTGTPLFAGSNTTIARPIVLAGTSGGIIDTNGKTITFSGTTNGEKLTLNDSSFGSQLPGTLILTGLNTPNSTTITKGTLQVGDGATTSSISGNISNSDVLIFNQALGTDTYTDNITGTGSVTKRGAGRTNLTGTHNVGAFALEAGTLGLGAGSMTATDFTASNGTTLSLAVGAETPLTATDVTLGTGMSLNISGITSQAGLNRTLISSTNNLSGSFDSIIVVGFTDPVDYLTLQTQPIQPIMDSPGMPTITWPTFTLTNLGDAFTVGAVLANVAANGSVWNGRFLTKNSLGKLTLSGANTYTGGTVLNTGTLGLGHNTALGTNTLTYGAAATLQLEATGLSIANNITLTNTVINTFDLNGNSGTQTGQPHWDY
jgi:autotransporter-associated beta strand protein